LKSKAVIDLLGDPELRGLAKSVCPKHSDDLIQEVALLLLEMPDDKWRQI